MALVLGNTVYSIWWTNPSIQVEGLGPGMPFVREEQFDDDDEPLFVRWGNNVTLVMFRTYFLVLHRELLGSFITDSADISRLEGEVVDGYGDIRECVVLTSEKRIAKIDYKSGKITYVTDSDAQFIALVRGYILNDQMTTYSTLGNRLHELAKHNNLRLKGELFRIAPGNVLWNEYSVHNSNSDVEIISSDELDSPIRCCDVVPRGRDRDIYLLTEYGTIYVITYNMNSKRINDLQDIGHGYASMLLSHNAHSARPHEIRHALYGVSPEDGSLHFLDGMRVEGLPTHSDMTSNDVYIPRTKTIKSARS